VNEADAIDQRSTEGARQGRQFETSCFLPAGGHPVRTTIIITEEVPCKQKPAQPPDAWKAKKYWLTKRQALSISRVMCAEAGS